MMSVSEQERLCREARTNGTLVRGGPADRYLLCGPSRKVRYRSMESAERVLAQILTGKSKRYGHVERRAYECPSCGGWHLTSMDREVAA